MKRRPPYTIVERPSALEAECSDVHARFTNKLRQRAPKAASRLQRMPQALKAALWCGTPAVQAALKNPKVGMTQGLRDMSEAIERFTPKHRIATIGLLDIGAWVARLPEMLSALNKVQNRVVFLELQTAMPSGLLKSKEHLIAWAERHGVRLSKKEKEELTGNVLADEFFYFGEALRKRHELDMVMGITPFQLAFLEGRRPRWGYYVVGQEGVSMVSTGDLRDYARRAGRPYEAAVGMLLVAQALSTRNDIDYHDETRGCIFDFDDDRADIVEAIRSMRIEPSCLAQLKNRQEQVMAQDLVATLARMKEKSRG